MAARIIEVVSGQPLDRFLEERLFDPLGMVDTAFFIPEDKLDRLAAMYVIKEGKLVSPPMPVRTNPPKLLSGGGGLGSTMDDYIRFSMMLLNGGVAGGERVLSKKAVELMMTNQLSEQVKHPKPNYMHGLGCIIEPDTGEYGWSGATSPYFRIDPKNNLLILTMTQFRPNSHKTYGVDFKNLIRDGLE